jgi:hypothetical protein
MRQPEKPGTVQFFTELSIRLLRDTANQLGLHPSSFEKDIASIRGRSDNEGMAFFAKSLPSLAKALDKAISQDTQLAVPLCFKKQKYGTTEIPILFGTLWKLIFATDGKVKEDDLSDCDVRFIRRLVGLKSDWPKEHTDSAAQVIAVRAIRQICYLAYKLELSYSKELVTNFLDDYVTRDRELPSLGESRDALSPECRSALENAAILLHWVLGSIDPYTIVPKHGPGAVATGEKAHEKMNFKRYYPSLDEVYSYADYMFVNYSHLCDELHGLRRFRTHKKIVSKVCLVPKDSRGPRLISMEPLEIQWIQQGLGALIVNTVESERSITSGYVNFTCQDVNRRLALNASYNGSSETDCLVTLDMKDASDRVSAWLVEQIFPPHVSKCLFACRSTYNALPDGRLLPLRKFAPMGSACCFPVEALTFWAIAVGSLVSVRRKKDLAGLPEVYVYGDDLIARKCDYAKFRPIFEELHLRFNDDKCCTGRFFRESCGLDAFKLNCVNPVRFKTLWPKRGTSPTALLSYISYANALRDGDRRYDSAANFVEDCIFEQFGPLPVTSYEADYMFAFKRDSCSREETVESLRAFKYRWNAKLQRHEWKLPQLFPATVEWSKGSSWNRLFLLNQIDVDPFGFGGPVLFGESTVPHTVKMRWTWIAGDRLSGADGPIVPAT